MRSTSLLARSIPGRHTWQMQVQQHPHAWLGCFDASYPINNRLSSICSTGGAKSQDGRSPWSVSPVKKIQRLSMGQHLTKSSTFAGLCRRFLRSTNQCATAHPATKPALAQVAAPARAKSLSQCNIRTAVCDTMTARKGVTMAFFVIRSEPSGRSSPRKRDDRDIGPSPNPKNHERNSRTCARCRRSMLEPVGPAVAPSAFITPDLNCR